MKTMISYLLFTVLFLTSCSEEIDTSVDEKSATANETTAIAATSDAKAYWYNNEAEISSYNLTQARYGETHEGKAVFVFVTEPFSSNKMSKVDNPTKNDVSVLKLNSTKKFNTGIYPYSMMTSTFFPFENGEHSIKITSSSQEWCGHTYMELQNKKQFEVQIASYFEDESEEKITLSKEVLEDDIWTMIRLAPNKLPTGDVKMIPSFFYLRLLHKDLKAYSCTADNVVEGDSARYVINYPDLDRTLSIHYESAFPYKILYWTETYLSGFGNNKKELTTTATRIKTIKSDYWNKNSKLDKDLRVKLGLE
jgi:hypothetical protein